MEYFLSHFQQTLSLISIIPLLLFESFARGSPAQEKQESTAQTVDWRALTAKSEAALGSEFQACDKNHRWIDIVQTADVTGDGIRDALIEYCHMGAYTSDVVLMRMERGNPVLARFRDKSGKIVPVGFTRGASVMHGETAKLFPEKHAVCAFHWDWDNDAERLATCTVEAYVWIPKTETFDEDEGLSKEIAQRNCNPELVFGRKANASPKERR